MSVREYRNVTYSLIDYITAQLTADGWSGISVKKDYPEAYKNNIPCIVIGVGDRNSEIISREVGSTSYLEDVYVAIRIFTNKEELRLDLTNWLVSKIMPGIDYYEYTIVSGEVSEKTIKGRIRILRVIDNRKELTNTESLEEEDRYRTLFSFSCRVALS